MLIILVADLFFGDIAFAGNPPSPKCIGGGNETTINDRLSGPRSRAVLCPGAVIEISPPIIMGFDDQELTTLGSPRGESRALVRVTGNQQSIAIQSRASGIHIHHLMIDGQRRERGRVLDGGALLELGGAVHGVRVDHIRAFDPRGWSAMHVFEGGGLCTDARITDSQFGPAGTPDGVRADGISFCMSRSASKRLREDSI